MGRDHSRPFLKGNMEGLILDCLGGIYTAETDEGIVSCKARGLFRKNGISPCAGDICDVEDGVITGIHERKNYILRPPLANIDIMIFVVSTCQPSPDTQILDGFIAVCEYKGISPVIALTKNDLKTNTFIPEIYSDICPVIICDYTDDRSIDPIRDIISGKVIAFTGNTGVGKSTLLNHISPDLDVETSEISRKLGRGRHTTRVSRLYKVLDGYAADTPGFATFDFTQYADITAPELASCFREFDRFTGKCRFSDCSHTREKDCAVIEAVNEGLIARTRHESYIKMYDVAKNIKDWQRKST